MRKPPAAPPELAFFRAAVAALCAHAKVGHGIGSVSIGITALVPSPELSAAQLFGIADAALYEAKNSGRNRVMGHK